MGEEEEKRKSHYSEWDLEMLADLPPEPVFAVEEAIAKPARRNTSKTRASHYHKWTKEEDEQLRQLADQYSQDWKTIAQYFKDKSSTSVKKRWDLRHNPNTKKSKWTPEEDQMILKMREKLGGGYWKSIAKYLPGRPPDAIKNRFYSALRRTLSTTQETEVGPFEDEKSEESEEEQGHCGEEEAFEMLAVNEGKKEQLEETKPGNKLSAEEKNEKIQQLRGTLETLEQLLQRTKAEIKLIAQEIEET